MSATRGIALIVVLGLLLLAVGCAQQDTREDSATAEPSPQETVSEEIAPEPTVPETTEPGDEPSDRLMSEGHFVLELDGAQILDEEYAVAFQPEEGYMLISQSTLDVGGVTIELAQQAQFDRELRPVFYQLAAETPSGAQIISAQMGLEGLTMEVRVGSSTRDAVIADARDTALLDNNVISHFAVLLMAIRADAIEPAFTAAIPQALLSLPGRFEGPSPAVLRSPAGELEAERFDVFLGDTRIVLVAVDGRLGVLANVSQGTFGYDLGLFPEGVEVAGLLEDSSLPESIVEETLSFENDDLILEGTLATPSGSGPHPAVLFLHGSGPVDRDGNAAGMPMDAYRQLAHVLAEGGVASFRYDKRGVGASGGDTATASMTDLISDGVAALNVLRQHNGIDSEHLFLVGHSEGAYLAPRIALEESVAGIALLAGAARPLDEITWWQIETMLRQSEAPLAQIEAARVQQNEYFAFVENSTGEWSDYTNEDLQAEMTWLSDVAADQIRATPLGLSWLREHYTADTQRTLARIGVPVFALNGEKDTQVPASEGALISEILMNAGNEDVVVYALEDLNHLLRYHPEEPSLIVRHIDQPVDERVGELLLGWILDVVGR